MSKVRSRLARTRSGQSRRARPWRSPPPSRQGDDRARPVAARCPMLVQRELERMILAGELRGRRQAQRGRHRRHRSACRAARCARRSARSRNRAWCASRRTAACSCARSASRKPTRSTSCAPRSTNGPAGALAQIGDRRARSRAARPRRAHGARRGAGTTSTPTGCSTSTSTTGWSTLAGNAKLLATYRRLVNELQPVSAADARAGRDAAGLDARASRDRRQASPRATPPPPDARCTTTSWRAASACTRRTRAFRPDGASPATSSRRRKAR